MLDDEDGRTMLCISLQTPEVFGIINGATAIAAIKSLIVTQGKLFKNTEKAAHQFHSLELLS